MNRILLRILVALSATFAVPSVHANHRERFVDLSDQYWGGAPQSGWGVHVAWQGDAYFVSWFTYDEAGAPMWVVMPRAVRTAGFRYEGALYRTRGPASSAPWTISGPAVTVTEVGAGVFKLGDDAGNDVLQLQHTLGGVTRTLDLQSQYFAHSQCTVRSFQGVWWSDLDEPGWGLMVNHQGDILFVIWLTYDITGRATWVVMPRGERVAGSDTFHGALYRTTGPSYSSQTWDPARVVATEVGNATFAFSDASNGSFRFTLDGTTRAMTIVPQGIRTTQSQCPGLLR